MTNPAPIAELWRNGILESTHLGHAVVCDRDGNIIHAWGDPETVIFPRSSCKMVQALPLIESGAADAFGLSNAQLALSCASHNGAAIHTDRVSDWLNMLDLSENDLRCGSHAPTDKDSKFALIRSDKRPCQIHNNCSGKHTGFLTVSKHLGYGAEYVDPDHPLQLKIREVFEETTGMDSPGFGIDGCSAPNFATTVHGLARSMATFAKPDLSTVRGKAATRLVAAMAEYPELVAGEGRACTELMRASSGKAVVKTGAEGVYVGILPELGYGIALKAVDGATRAAESAMAAILIKLAALDANHPAALMRMAAVQKNWRGIETGIFRSII